MELNDSAANFALSRITVCVLRFATIVGCVIGLGAFGCTNAHAQMTTYNIDGEFDDGTPFSGYFNYDPTANVFGSYDIITILGVSSAGDGNVISGYEYTADNSTPTVNGGDGVQFVIDSSGDGLYIQGGDGYLPTDGTSDPLDIDGGDEVANDSVSSRKVTDGALSVPNLLGIEPVVVPQPILTFFGHFKPKFPKPELLPHFSEFFEIEPGQIGNRNASRNFCRPKSNPPTKLSVPQSARKNTFGRKETW
jgi:hypothetical protein